MTDDHTSYPYDYKKLRGGIFKTEYFWRDHQRWLADAGYMLRPRYREDWVPSWLGSGQETYRVEDGELARSLPVVLDAVRTADGRIVTLKRVEKSNNYTEEDVSRFLNDDRFTNCPENHAVPVYEILQSPLYSNSIFLVMPYLIRIDTVRFSTVGEVMEFFRQLFEGLKFMHSVGVAHCDIGLSNVMMDPVPLLSDIPHPVHGRRSYDFQRKVKSRTRTEHPTRYHYIDFGLSDKFNPGQPHISAISIGGDKTVPEYADPSGLYNPFHADIYTLGNLVREHFVQKSSSLGFLETLISDMTKTAPEERPTIGEAFERFEEIRTSLSQWQLRSRFVYRDEFFMAKLYRACRHVIRTIIYVRKNYPALPTPTRPRHSQPICSSSPTPSPIR
ncbi:kinase-like domain-containing protein, partial [Earliella scabrosa]